LPMITADPAQLKQVLVNLVVNAVQAMPDGGTLIVSTRASDSCVLLTVVDTGVGMSEDVREKILLPFFTTKDVNEGTGLGLAVVHGIVTSHGGSIKVESQPGHGTRLEIRLPVTGPGNTQEAGQDDACT
jgi:two-component system NtrC family sensor kinase